MSSGNSNNMSDALVLEGAVVNSTAGDGIMRLEVDSQKHVIAIAMMFSVVCLLLSFWCFLCHRQRRRQTPLKQAFSTVAPFEGQTSPVLPQALSRYSVPYFANTHGCGEMMNYAATNMYPKSISFYDEIRAPPPNQPSYSPFTTASRDQEQQDIGSMNRSTSYGQFGQRQLTFADRRGSRRRSSDASPRRTVSATMRLDDVSYYHASPRPFHVNPYLHSDQIQNYHHPHCPMSHHAHMMPPFESTASPILSRSSHKPTSSPSSHKPTLSSPSPHNLIAPASASQSNYGQVMMLSYIQEEAPDDVRCTQGDAVITGGIRTDNISFSSADLDTFSMRRAESPIASLRNVYAKS